MNNELISVIMPAYNTEKYVSEAVESVINQTYTNWELLAIDDGSTDNTGNILDNYAKTDSRIKVFHQKNKGVSAARNVGLDNAKGTWIVFLDSDDYYFTDAMEKMINSSYGFELVIAGYCFCYNNNIFTRNLINKTYTSKKQIIQEELVVVEKNRFFSSVWGMLWKKDSIKKQFKEDCYICEDSVFFSENVCCFSKINVIENSVLMYRTGNEQSVSHDKLRFNPDVVSRECKYIEQFYDKKNKKGALYAYAKFMNYFICYVENIIYSTSQKEQKDEMIIRALQNEYFVKIPLVNIGLSLQLVHLWLVLLTKDLDLIYEAFQEACKKKKND